MHAALRRLILVTFTSVLFYTLASFVLDEVYVRNSVVAGSWQKDPMIVICRESKMPIANVLNAIAYWESKSFEIDHYTIDYEDYICNQSFPLGFILIRHDGEMPEDSVGVTRRMIVAGTVISAEIVIPNRDVNIPLILEHELGHALGLNHVNSLGHIMHPFIDHAGKKFWIP